MSSLGCLQLLFVILQAERLKRLLLQLLGWSYDFELLNPTGSLNLCGDDEDDEYAPQVVEL